MRRHIDRPSKGLTNLKINHSHYNQIPFWDAWVIVVQNSSFLSCHFRWGHFLTRIFSFIWLSEHSGTAEGPFSLWGFWVNVDSATEQVVQWLSGRVQISSFCSRKKISAWYLSSICDPSKEDAFCTFNSCFCSLRYTCVCTAMRTGEGDGLQNLFLIHRTAWRPVNSWHC